MSASQGGIYSVLDDTRINGRRAFFQGLGMGFDGSWASRLGGSIIQSTQEVESYKDIGSVPQIEQWDGELRFRELPVFGGALRNIEYGIGMRVQKADLRRDKTGRIRERMSQFGTRVSRHWETLISSLILAGETDGSKTINGDPDLTVQSYDGQAFFDTDHSFTGGTFTTSQSNDLPASTYASLNISSSTAPTVSEASAFLTDLIGHFWTFKDDQGEPTNGDAKRFVVMVGTNQLFAPIMSAFSLQSLASGENSRAYGAVNTLGITVDVILNPRLSARTTKVYIFNLDGTGDTPFLLQEETPIAIAEDSGKEWDKDVKVGAWGTRTAGFGNWMRGLVGTLE